MAEGLESRAYFFGCQSEEECVITEGLCPDTWIAINKTYVLEHIENSKQFEIECPAPDPSAMVPVKATCVENKCVKVEAPEKAP
jgi:hypothetical protein